MIDSLHLNFYVNLDYDWKAIHVQHFLISSLKHYCVKIMQIYMFPISNIIILTTGSDNTLRTDICVYVLMAKRILPNQILAIHEGRGFYADAI